MIAGKYDIICEQGATFARVLLWQDENELPINLLGYTARMQVRPSFQSNEIMVSLTTENGGISLLPSEGRIELFLSDVQTDELKPRRAVYDLELVSPGGFVTRLLEGTFTIAPQVTR